MGPFMSIHSTGLGDHEPLVVSPRHAQQILDIGHSRLYELIAAKELATFKDGKSRKITVESIKAYVARKLEAQPAAATANAPAASARKDRSRAPG
jgi:hypothetical protein